MLFRLTNCLALILLALVSAATAQKATNPSPPDTAEGITTRNLLLDWDDVPGAIAYGVFLGPDGGQSNYSTTTSSHMTIDRLAPLRFHVWRIDAFFPEGVVQGDVWRFVTYGTPDAVTNPNPSDNAVGLSSTVTLSWTPGKWAEWFDITVRNSEEKVVATKQITSGSSFTVNNLPPDDYTWMVITHNGAGYRLGPTWKFSTHYLDAPGQASNPQPADGATGIARSFVARWTAAPLAYNYDVYTGPTTDTLTLFGNTTKRELTLEGFAPDSDGYWQVVARNNAGSTPGPIWKIHTIDSGESFDFYDPDFQLGAYLKKKDELISYSGTPANLTAAAPGDLNGDGYADILLAKPNYEFTWHYRRFTIPPTYEWRGRLAAHFGRPEWPLEVDEDPAGDEGFSVLGENKDSELGSALFAVGDINEDGFSDYGARIGRTVVVGNDTILLQRGQLSLSSESFAQDTLGKLRYASVTPVGNLNGRDGSDLLAYGANTQRRLDVLFGSYARLLENLGTVTSLDHRINTGKSLGGIRSGGDFNGDGYGDFLILPRTDELTLRVIFGALDFSYHSIDFQDLNGSNGVEITYGNVKWSDYDACGIGDFNGDGYDDLLVVTPNRASIVYGRSSPADEIDSTTDADTFRVAPPTADRFRTIASAAGDINGDGIADAVISMNNYNAFILYGGTDQPEDTVITDIERKIPVHSAFDFIRVQYAGDVNGDARDDLLGMAYQGNTKDVRRAVLLFGRHDTTVSTSSAFAAPGDAAQTAIGLMPVDQPIPASRLWINFTDGAGPGGGASLVTASLHRGAINIENLPSSPNATVAWNVTTNRDEWTSAVITVRYLDSETEGMNIDQMNAYIAPSPTGPWQVAPGQVRLHDRHFVCIPVNSSDFGEQGLWIALGTSPIIPGDINMDGIVDAADLVAMRQYLNGSQSAALSSEEAGAELQRALDLHPRGGDGYINESDLIALEKMLLGGN